MDAVATSETLGQSVKDAGTGKYCGFLLVEALRDKGYRLVLEQLPIEVDLIDDAKLSDIRRLASADETKAA
jgi:hypothetical protein